jgi:xanthine dehydrogenase YagT iron-sulfur-binding subunit
MSRAPLRGLIDAATQTFDALRPVQQPVPFVSSASVVDSDDLVARALAILTEEADTWRARQAATRIFEVPGGNQAQPGTGGGDPAHTVSVRLTVNGTSHMLSIDPRSSLLDVLRELLALTGAKKGCDHGQCGACTVHIDGRGVLSCLMPAVQADGRQVTTIEGLSLPGGDLHPMQQAFIDHDALQCGYCTPGQIMAAVACVSEGHATSPEQIREYLSGNICRCGAYVGILAAIQDAAPKMRRA